MSVLGRLCTIVLYLGPDGQACLGQAEGSLLCLDGGLQVLNVGFLILQLL
jgi:hypothetical protein